MSGWAAGWMGRTGWWAGPLVAEWAGHRAGGVAAGRHVLERQEQRTLQDLGMWVSLQVAVGGRGTSPYRFPACGPAQPACRPHTLAHVLQRLPLPSAAMWWSATYGSCTACTWPPWPVAAVMAATAMGMAASRACSRPVGWCRLPGWRRSRAPSICPVASQLLPGWHAIRGLPGWLAEG